MAQPRVEGPDGECARPRADAGAGTEGRPGTEVATGRGRLPRPRTRTLAAGGAVLAHVWGLGLGVGTAYAADGPAATELLGADLVQRADAPALLGQLTGLATPVLEQQTASVAKALQERIRTDGLPLPGQATTVPDAFAIAAVLLPSVPPQARGDEPRASRATAEDAGQPAAPGAGAAAVRPRLAPTATPGASAAAGAVRTADAMAASTSPVIRSATVQLPQGSWTLSAPEEQVELAGTSAASVEAEGEVTAVLVPIAAGMLLTGAAMYKHKGLPRGH
ncbi:hypothetical protein ACIRBX_30340 [Kitasatospora sp. NPDC096147]|uniref:hypothetical protein n=1 Tax=Kitasatospora sp. NPDC096147 TaxID=3364093 RepID=UPI0038105298